MSARPFRFAVQAANASSAAEWRDFARRVEDLGYSTLFLADHYLGPGPARRAAHTPQQDLAPIAAMAAAAAVTRTLRIGCRVFCVDYHVPAVLAKEAATLDLLSDGRLELGLGGGWSEGEYQAMGIPFERAGRRIAKLEEVVALVKAHFAGEELDCEGEFVNVRGYAGTPARRPAPAIMIGGAKKRVLSLAGREADIASISNVPFVAVNEEGLTPEAEAVRRVGFVRAAAGERMAALDVESSPYFTEITENPKPVLERVAANVRMEAELLAEHPNVLVGPAEALIERLEARREKIGFNYVSVQQAQAESFAPIAARLCGR